MSRRARTALIAVVLTLATSIFGPSAIAATTVLNGVIVSDDALTLSPDAVAVVTLVDQTATEGAGAIVGQQRIDAVASVPIPFEVLYDDAAIDVAHSYALFAAVIDGDAVYQSAQPVPVITGGPRFNVEVPVAPAPESRAKLDGTIVRTDLEELSKVGVAMAVLVKETTGTVVNVATVQKVPSTGDIPFSIGYDPELIDPAARYVVRASIIDGGSIWDTPEPAEAIVEGTPAESVEVAVEPRSSGIPIPPTPEPTATPAATAAPTEAPTAAPTDAPTTAPTEAPTEAPTARPTIAPTAEPTATPAPTATPTPEPTPSPSPTPTPSPSPSPTPSPTASPSPTPSPSPSETASAPPPAAGRITGTLTYVEPAPLSPSARALVVLVEGAGTASAGSVVASDMIGEPAQVPVPFVLDYSHVAIDQNVTYSLQATIVDGDRTWVTTAGTPVITRGNPTSGLTLALTYRADVLKGDVTGSISGVDIELGDEAFSAAVLLDLATDTTVGIDVHLQPGSTPIRFAIPFDPAKIAGATDYVVGAAIVDEPDRWENREGVPVITKGNPISDVTVPVSAVVSATTETDDGRSALVIVLIVLGLLAAALYVYQRSRSEEPAPAEATSDATAGDVTDEPPPPEGP
jgi:uncharacterized lipoprotein YbaY